jgi:hypothetical protein
MLEQKTLFFLPGRIQVAPASRPGDPILPGRDSQFSDKQKGALFLLERIQVARVSRLGDPISPRRVLRGIQLLCVKVSVFGSRLTRFGELLGMV